jgi:hypothetical protein
LIIRTSGDNIIPIVASGVTMKQSLSGLSAFFKTTEVYVTGGTYTAGTAFRK